MDIPLNLMSSQSPPLPTEQEIQALITLLEQIRICNYATRE